MPRLGIYFFLLAPLSTAAVKCGVSRRQAFPQILGAASCVCCRPEAALALAALAEPDASLYSQYATPRDACKDKGFARGMSTGMGSYENAIKPTKEKLFDRMLSALPAKDAVVVELGVGAFPNAPFYAQPALGSGPQGMDIVGVDPNVAMAEYANNAAENAGLLARGHSLRVVNGVGEALPLPDNSADAVVCTLTLCSVPSPEAVIADVRRVLKPNGQFLFCEHVLSQTDFVLAAQQRALTPLQVEAADGCHLDRETLKTVKSAGFAKVDAEEFELNGFWILSPTVAGIARA